MSQTRHGIGHGRILGLSSIVLLLTLGPLSVQGIGRLAINRAAAFEATPKTLAAAPVASRKSTSTAIRQRQPTAVVIVGAANVRTGPGTVYPRVTIVRRSDKLTILGQANGCTWLKVVTPKRLTGWISASLTDWSAACRGVPTAVFSPAPATNTQTRRPPLITPELPMETVVPPSETIPPPPTPSDTLEPPPTPSDTPGPTGTPTDVLEPPPTPSDTDTPVPQPTDTPESTPTKPPISRTAMQQSQLKMSRSATPGRVMGLGKFLGLLFVN